MGCRYQLGTLGTVTLLDHRMDQYGRLGGSSCDCGPSGKHTDPRYHLPGRSFVRTPPLASISHLHWIQCDCISRQCLPHPPAPLSYAISTILVDRRVARNLNYHSGVRFSGLSNRPCCLWRVHQRNWMARWPFLASRTASRVLLFDRIRRSCTLRRRIGQRNC